jgi:PPOX class probable F420-dependent enzyme
MMATITIPDGFKDVLTQKQAFASLATVGADGGPQVTPVWFDWDGTHLRFNSAKGRVKDQNVRRTPKVALAIVDPDNPYRYLQIKGRVAEMTETGADAHIDSLAKKYMGVDKYPYRKPGEVRVIYKVIPERVQTNG